LFKKKQTFVIFFWRTFKKKEIFSCIAVSAKLFFYRKTKIVRYELCFPSNFDEVDIVCQQFSLYLRTNLAIFI